MAQHSYLSVTWAFSTAVLSAFKQTTSTSQAKSTPYLIPFSYITPGGEKPPLI